ncbi:hypothetical protein JIN77_10550 [Verrucomicrobiaceae bacterium R5-34]|nr:hypothetical protein [Verrucomicrobiaceae bacterium R5-34]
MKLRPLIHFLFLPLLLISPLYAMSTGDEVMAALKEKVDGEGDFDEIYDSVDDLPINEVNALFKKIDKIWPRMRDSWISDFSRLAKDSSSKSSDQKKYVRELREELAAMKDLEDGPMKTVLKKRGMPILNELRKILLPKTADVLATTDAETKKKRRTLVAIAGLRDALIKAAIIPSTTSSMAELKEAEQSVTRSISGLDRKGLKVMESNFKVAKRKKVPEAERIGVADANLMRLLAGYTALEIDPKLCETGRDHSKDMETHNFFAHMSPVKGKRTPGDRAKNFGTRGNGENIYMGNESPLAANKAWFYSPGHHRNLFRPNWKVIGMGRHNRHWTQMFF